MSGEDDPEYRYKDYLMQERRDENLIEQVIYLDQKLILTITHRGTIRNKQLTNTILNQIDLKRIDSD